MRSASATARFGFWIGHRGAAWLRSEWYTIFRKLSVGDTGHTDCARIIDDGVPARVVRIEYCKRSCSTSSSGSPERVVTRTARFLP